MQFPSAKGCIAKLPVMICSNFDLFQGELWDCRIKKYMWQEISFGEYGYMPILLKELNPFAVREFFQNWGYMINNNTNDVVVDLYSEINMTVYTCILFTYKGKCTITIIILFLFHRITN